MPTDYVDKTDSSLYMKSNQASFREMSEFDPQTMGKVVERSYIPSSVSHTLQNQQFNGGKGGAQMLLSNQFRMMIKSETEVFHYRTAIEPSCDDDPAIVSQVFRAAYKDIRKVF